MDSESMDSESMEDLSLENGDADLKNLEKGKSPESRPACNFSLATKIQDPAAVGGGQRGLAGEFIGNLKEVVFGSRLCVLLLAIPMAVIADFYSFGRPWIFALSLMGLAPLAERLSFLTEQAAYYTGSTVGGLLNATCGNATELIIALLALHKRKIHVLKYSLLGSILSNLLLVLGSSLLCGGLVNLNSVQKFDKTQAGVNLHLLLLGLLCHILPLMYKNSVQLSPNSVANSALRLSRGCSIFMLLAYIAYLIFQLKTQNKLFESQQEGEGEDENEEEKAIIGFWSSLIWLILITITIGLLSEYVVGTIEVASDTWGISVSFISIILLPIVGNAAEHAGSIIFAFKNKLDISLGVALGSACQISMFVVPLCVIVAWIMRVDMDLDFGCIQTGSLAFAIILTAVVLQDGTSHYLNGVILCLSYIVIAACFCIYNGPHKKTDAGKIGARASARILAA